MKAFITRGLRPLQCAHAMASGGILSSPSGALLGAVDRITRAAFQFAGRLRASGVQRTQPGPAPEPEAPRVSHVELVPNAFRRKDGSKDIVDEASWQSFPASDPPGY